MHGVNHFKTTKFPLLLNFTSLVNRRRIMRYIHLTRIKISLIPSRIQSTSPLLPFQGPYVPNDYVLQTRRKRQHALTGAISQVQKKRYKLSTRPVLRNYADLASCLAPLWFTSYQLHSSSVSHTHSYLQQAGRCPMRLNAPQPI